MKLSTKTKKSISRWLICGAFIAVLLSVVGWLVRDIWLASSTWLLVAAVLTLFGIYFKLG
jgi:hypothetical protein